MKTTSSFKMSKQTKRSLALSNFRNQEEKTNFRKLMIQAQLYSNVILKAPKQEVDNS